MANGVLCPMPSGLRYRHARDPRCGGCTRTAGQAGPDPVRSRAQGRVDALHHRLGWARGDPHDPPGIMYETALRAIDVAGAIARAEHALRKAPIEEEVSTLTSH